MNALLKDHWCFPKTEGSFYHINMGSIQGHPAEKIYAELKD